MALIPPVRSPSPRATVWLDLAALLDPAGVFRNRAMAQPAPDWPALYRLAAAHLVAPSLYATLAAREQLHWVPGEVREALEALYQLNTQRNRRLRAVLRDTVHILNQADIEPILLKGAIALLPGQYPHAFARMLGDLDIGVAEAEPNRAAEALQAAGFYCAPNINPALWRAADHHHWLPLFHPSGDGYVELHHDLFSARMLKAALSLPSVQARAKSVEWEGMRLKIPLLEHRLLHNALHHQLQDQAFFSDRRSLRQLLKFAQLRALPEAATLDWPALVQRLDAVGVGNALRGSLLAAHRLFGQPLPDGVSLTRTARWAEERFWFRLNHPRLGRWLELRWQFVRYAHRLSNLPKRLLTPAWYPAKYRFLRQRWFPKRPSFDEDLHD